MTKKKVDNKSRDSFRIWLKDTFNELSDIFLTDSYTIDYVDANDNGSPTKVLAVSCRFEYRTIKIYVYENAYQYYKKGELDYLKMVITHELAHVITSRLADLGEDRFISRQEFVRAVEETASSLCITLWNLYKKQ